MPSRYVPARGDIVWLEFDPSSGHEHAGRRPALVLSPRTYNEKVGLGLFCPITNQVKGYPFEVLLPRGLKARGAILADQVKSLDWVARNATRICQAPEAVLEQVLAKVAALLGAPKSSN